MHFQGEHAEKLVQPESKGMDMDGGTFLGSPLDLPQAGGSEVHADERRGAPDFHRQCTQTPFLYFVWTPTK
jgi:hypothetical protein